METSRILLVDDEPDVLDSLASVLAHESPRWEIITATNAAEALDKWDDIQVVVSDHRMPGMTGVELLAKVRTTHPETVRVLVTAYADLDVAIAALENAEVHYYLRKPWDPKEIRSLISSAMEAARSVKAA